MGVQRAKPIDLSAGNEPFHMNGGRGERARARCLCLCVGVLSAAGFHMAALRFPLHSTDNTYLLMINVKYILMEECLNT